MKYRPEQLHSRMEDPMIEHPEHNTLHPSTRKSATAPGALSGTSLTDVSLSGISGDQEPSKRVDSWKHIANYFRRDVRTVQRWERQEGLPVHRHSHRKSSSVYALRGELNAWWRSRDISNDSADLQNRRALPFIQSPTQSFPKEPCGDSRNTSGPVEESYPHALRRGALR
jgi:hypothetical protein